MKRKWSEIAGNISKVNPQLYKVLQKYDGIEDVLFNEYQYNYGDVVADEESFYTPDGSKKDRVPFCLIYDRSFEMYIDFQGKTSTFKVYKPGELLGVSSFYKQTNNHHPGDILRISAGARNSIMLFPASEIVHHTNIENYFGEPIKRPSDLSSHHSTLKSLANLAKPDWKAKLIVFPDEINNKLMQRQLPELLNIIYEYDTEQWSYYSNMALYNYIMGHIKHQDSDISSNVFINDAISHIFTICSGQVPAYGLAMDNQLLPVDTFVDIYKDIYHSANIPLLFQPQYFSGDTPVYYSVSKEELAFKPDVFSNQPLKCHQLYNSFNCYAAKVNEMSVYSGTQFAETAQKVKLTMFNEKKVQEKIQKFFHFPSETIPTYDNSFHEYIEKHALGGLKFPVKTGYFAGCFGIKNENN